MSAATVSPVVTGVLNPSQHQTPLRSIKAARSPTRSCNTNVNSNSSNNFHFYGGAVPLSAHTSVSKNDAEKKRGSIVASVSTTSTHINPIEQSFINSTANQNNDSASRYIYSRRPRWDVVKEAVTARKNVLQERDNDSKKNNVTQLQKASSKTNVTTDGVGDYKEEKRNPLLSVDYSPVQTHSSSRRAVTVRPTARSSLSVAPMAASPAPTSAAVAAANKNAKTISLENNSNKTNTVPGKQKKDPMKIGQIKGHKHDAGNTSSGAAAFALPRSSRAAEVVRPPPPKTEKTATIGTSTVTPAEYEGVGAPQGVLQWVREFSRNVKSSKTLDRLNHDHKRYDDIRSVVTVGVACKKQENRRSYPMPPSLAGADQRTASQMTSQELDSLETSSVATEVIRQNVHQAMVTVISMTHINDLPETHTSHDKCGEHQKQKRAASVKSRDDKTKQKVSSSPLSQKSAANTATEDADGRNIDQLQLYIELEQFLFSQIEEMENHLLFPLVYGRCVSVGNSISCESRAKATPGTEKHTNSERSRAVPPPLHGHWTRGTRRSGISQRPAVHSTSPGSRASIQESPISSPVESLLLYHKRRADMDLERERLLTPVSAEKMENTATFRRNAEINRTNTKGTVFLDSGSNHGVDLKISPPSFQQPKLQSPSHVMRQPVAANPVTLSSPPRRSPAINDIYDNIIDKHHQILLELQQKKREAGEESLRGGNGGVVTSSSVPPATTFTVGNSVVSLLLDQNQHQNKWPAFYNRAVDVNGNNNTAPTDKMENSLFELSM